jgi:hypothetical protein
MENTVKGMPRSRVMEADGSSDRTADTSSVALAGER